MDSKLVIVTTFVFSLLSYGHPETLFDFGTPHPANRVQGSFFAGKFFFNENYLGYSKTGATPGLVYFYNTNDALVARLIPNLKGGGFFISPSGKHLGKLVAIAGKDAQRIYDNKDNVIGFVQSGATPGMRYIHLYETCRLYLYHASE